MLQVAGVVSATQAGRRRGSKVHCAPGPTMAEQKPIEEMCPSPMPRRLTATRAWPARSPPWSGPQHRTRVAQGRALRRVLRGEGRAQQQRARRRQFARLRDVRGDDRRMPLQEHLIVVVTIAEVAQQARARMRMDRSTSKLLEDVCQQRDEAAFMDVFTAISTLLDESACSGHPASDCRPGMQQQLGIGATFEAGAVADVLRSEIGDMAAEGKLAPVVNSEGYPKAESGVDGRFGVPGAARLAW